MKFVNVLVLMEQTEPLLTYTILPTEFLANIH